MMELIRLFIFALFMTIIVAGIGAAVDVRLIENGEKAWLRPKWLWNLLEGIIIVLIVSGKFGSFTPFPWWQMAPLYASMAFVWSAVHDCMIGKGIQQDWWYLGQSWFDRQMFTMFNQFGLPAGLNYFVVKLFWAGMAGAAYFSL